jgi:O-antigen/teichoic acid export membrane protein
MSSGARIAKNAAWLVVATTLNKVLAFISFIVVARLTGPSVTGTYFFGVSVTSIFVTFADLGMTSVIIRAIAGARENAERLLGAGFRAKLILAPLAIAMALGYGFLKGVDTTTLGTIAIACLVMTADTFHLLLYGVLRGKQQLQPEAIGMFVGQVLTTLAAICAAVLHLGPMGLAAALLLGSLWNVLWALGKINDLELKILAPQSGDFRMLFREALPFGIAGIAVKVYSYVDSLMLQAFHGAKAVGIYSVAYKMTYALQFLPLTFSAALYPALAAAWSQKAHDELKRVFVGSLRLMAALSFPVAAGLSALSPRIIPLAYGNQYLPSIPSLEILPWVLIPIFMDFPVGSLLNATHRAHIKTSAMVGVMLINIVLNAVFVPRMGPVGASLAGVCSFFALYVFGMIFTAKDSDGIWTQLSIFLRALSAAGVSWYAWRVLGDRMPLAAAVVFGGAIAVSVAFLLRLVTPTDVKMVLRFRRLGPPKKEIHADA